MPSSCRVWRLVPGLNCKRQDAHADEVGAVDALEAFGGDGFHARQPHALRRPVAAGALSVVRAGVMMSGCLRFI